MTQVKITRRRKKKRKSRKKEKGEKVSRFSKLFRVPTLIWFPELYKILTSEKIPCQNTIFNLKWDSYMDLYSNLVSLISRKYLK